MKKTNAQIDLIKDSGAKFPLFWEVVTENDHFMHIRNWLAGKNRVCCK